MSRQMNLNLLHLGLDRAINERPRKGISAYII